MHAKGVKQHVALTVSVLILAMFSLPALAQQENEPNYVGRTEDNQPEPLIHRGQTLEDYRSEFEKVVSDRPQLQDYDERIKLYVEARENERFTRTGYRLEPEDVQLDRDAAASMEDDEFERALADEVQRLAQEMNTAKPADSPEEARSKLRDAQTDLFQVCLDVHIAARRIQQKRYANVAGALESFSAENSYSVEAFINNQSNVFEKYLQLNLWRSEADVLETAIAALTTPTGGEWSHVDDTGEQRGIDSRMTTDQFWLNYGLRIGTAAVGTATEVVLRKYANLLKRERVGKKKIQANGGTVNDADTVADHADEATEGPRGTAGEASTADRVDSARAGSLAGEVESGIDAARTAEHAMDVADDMADAAQAKGTRKLLSTILAVRHLPGWGLRTGGGALAWMAARGRRTAQFFGRCGHWLAGTRIGRVSRGLTEVVLVALVLDSAATAAMSTPIALDELGMDSVVFDELATVIAEIKAINDEFEVFGVDTNQLLFDLELFEAQALAEGIGLAVAQSGLDRKIRRIENELEEMLAVAPTKDQWLEKFGDENHYFLESINPPLKIIAPVQCLPTDENDKVWLEEIRDEIGS